ncbi:MAG TPA: glycoside hydrolase family 15 protein [Candidatus Limnocylindria bacterium]|nr:glycoside hydrolase family 15 protein [Candidatus Limnocylindria bacterium]
MSRPLEDYALIGDRRTAALVARDGTIAWLCVPRFDGGACFAALLGDDENGSWRLGPVDDTVSSKRAYRPESLVLDTVHEIAGGGRVRVTDALLLDGPFPRLVRLVEGQAGSVEMRSELRLRFDYGSVIPWLHQIAGTLVAVAGPDAAALYADVPLIGEGYSTVATFRVEQGQSVAFEMAWYPSHAPIPGPSDVREQIFHTDGAWRTWSRSCAYRGPHRALVVRSLLTLQALTHIETGAVVAAPTTSLPERLGGVRNWDYRFCWLRDATFVLTALLDAGYEAEAYAWRAWLLRAVAGNPANLQIMYGIDGARRIPEWTADWLHGYAESQPVRIGNAAVGQLQTDVYGEIVDVMFQAHRAGIPPDADEWALTTAVLDALESRWREPDHSLWEVRGDPRHFVHSKVLAWAAFDRAIAATERYGLEGPLERWRAARGAIHEQVCERGFDEERNTFTQSYGSAELDAATLLIPLVGFLPPDDPRVRGTIAAIEQTLLVDGFLRRYQQPSAQTDGLPPGEGAFYACGFWLVDNYVQQGRLDDAEALFSRLIGTANDVGLLAEQYAVDVRRQVGNFPQAFSHVGLVNSAFSLSRGRERRRGIHNGAHAEHPVRVG